MILEVCVPLRGAETSRMRNGRREDYREKRRRRRQEAGGRRRKRAYGKAETNGREDGMNLPLGYDLNQLML